MLKRILQSTNGTLNLVLLLLLALAASISFPESAVENLFVAFVAFAGAVREQLKNGIKFRWNSNVFMYISAGVLMMFPYLENLLPALEGLINALISGSTDKILAAIFVVANILWQLFQSKPWKEPTTAS